MDTDDTQIGRVLTRREVVALIGLSGAGLLAGRAFAQAGGPPAACVVVPQQGEGPFFVEERLNRSDIRVDPASGSVKPGAVLQLAFNVSALRAGGCAPLPGAHVDIWHCDAAGAYSDASQKFLRGYQVTNAEGTVRFTTIYPGGYQGRAVHIHFKIRTDPAAGRVQEFTSQVYFDDVLTDRVHALAPYASRGARRVRNDADGLFRHGGRQLTLALTPSAAGYTSTFNVALQRS